MAMLAFMPAYQRVAPTVSDDLGASVIARMLKRSRGVPLFFRLIADIVRLALAAALATAAWPKIAPIAGKAMPSAIPEEWHSLALGAELLLFATTIALVLFRITSRRFTQPLRARGS